MRKVLILNGPPGIGKDTLANLLHERHPVSVHSFKHELYIQAAKETGIDAHILEKLNSDRELKEARILSIDCAPIGAVVSVRQALQMVSEEIIKPRHGEAYFGEAAARYMRGLYCDVVVSDGGFPEEIKAVCREFGPENVAVARLHRGGVDFGTDTRRYIKDEDVPCKCFDVVTFDGLIESAYLKLKEIMYDRLGK